jgi:iron(III) transport system substrate-binding protein
VPPSSSNARWAILLPVVAALFLVVLWLMPGADRSNSLVVYCAHDSVYADQILQDFQRQTGIRVDVRYDTEATKSLGLINLIVQERHQPRCDVFWNNEMLGTLDLQSQGLLEPYQGSAWKRLPEKYRDPEGHWVGFGARLRVIIVNTQMAAADESTVRNLVMLEPSNAVVAKPLFGTTLTHYTVLWQAWGPERLKAWHQELRLRGLREVNGNGAVKDVVAGGTCAVGLTDTDDVFVALDDRLPVEMLPVRIQVARGQSVSAASDLDEASVPLSFSEPGENSHTICVPNTAAIVKGTRQLEAAQKLIDFLASAETELALAKSKSRQVPLGPVDESQLPADVRPLKAWADDGFDLRPLLAARRECLEWLKTEYVK